MSKKREKQQISRASISGRPRLCPVCKRMAYTQHGRFNRHGTADGTHFTECEGSGQKVEQHPSSGGVKP